MKQEKFIILGKSGSGKDFLLKGLIEKGERYSPKITTRPPREGELNGVDYLFTNNQQFELLLNIEIWKTIFLLNFYFVCSCIWTLKHILRFIQERLCLFW